MPDTLKRRPAEEESEAADVRNQNASQRPAQVGKPIGELRRVTKALGDSRKKAEAAFKSK